MTIRGVTVTFDRIVVHTTGASTLFVDFANNAGGPTLELDSDRVVVRQAGHRIVAQGASGVGLVDGGSSSGYSVLVPGFRPGVPFTVTATVTTPQDESASPAWKPLPFSFRFGAA